MYLCILKRLVIDTMYLGIAETYIAGTMCLCIPER
jgi:hypothetical protein